MGCLLIGHLMKRGVARIYGTASIEDEDGFTAAAIL